MDFVTSNRSDSLFFVSLLIYIYLFFQCFMCFFILSKAPLNKASLSYLSLSTSSRRCFISYMAIDKAVGPFPSFKSNASSMSFFSLSFSFWRVTIASSAKLFKMIGYFEFFLKGFYSRIRADYNVVYMNRFLIRYGQLLCCSPLLFWFTGEFFVVCINVHFVLHDFFILMPLAMRTSKY